jgi:phosphate-selective porin OprO and OprP
VISQAHAQAADASATNTEAARVERLEAQIQALQAQLDELKKQVAKPLPSWKGSPQFSDAEAQWNRVRGYRPGALASGNDAFAGDSAVTPLSNPAFFGAYGEVGYFLTGETRGYGSGNVWARTKVLNPINKGGSGAFQIAGRIDYLDLDTNALKTAPTNDFVTGTSSLAALNTRLGRGGTQTGYLLALNWYPIDYIRLMLNYIHVEVEGGPLAAIVEPLSTAPLDKRKYSTDGVALRAQVEF